jgi:large subunit ribosomal protein L19
MQNRLMTLVENTGIKAGVPDFEIGDTVDVHLRILEGQKERIQIFSGTVISRKGDGLRQMFTVRRIVQGEGVERQFPLHSPRIATIKVTRTGVVRRAKLYYLRDRVGKATRLRERKVKGAADNTKKGKALAAAKAAAATAAAAAAAAAPAPAEAPKV